MNYQVDYKIRHEKQADYISAFITQLLPRGIVPIQQNININSRQVHVYMYSKNKHQKHVHIMKRFKENKKATQYQHCAAIPILENRRKSCI